MEFGIPITGDKIVTKQYASDAGYTVIVSGPKVAGSSPPERAPSTQALVDYYLNLGIPANNILWNVVGESGAGGEFTMAGMTVNSFLDSITIVNPGETLLVQDVTGASVIDNILLELASGEFTIPDMAVASTVDGIVLALAGGTFVVADMTGASTMDEIVLELVGGGPIAVSDDFNRADNANLGANWTQLSGTAARWTISDNSAQAGAAVTGDLWSAATFSTNQYSEGKNEWIGLRMQSGAHSCYYLIASSVDEGDGYMTVFYYLKKVVAGTHSDIGTPWGYDSGGAGAPFTGIFRLEASGTTITFKTGASHGGSLTTRISATDASLSGGSPGLYNAGFGGASVDNWYGGDL